MSPPMMTINGIAILKKEAIIGVIRAERRSFAEKARWTTRKSVVQYPKDKTKPSPRTMPPQVTNIPF